MSFVQTIHVIGDDTMIRHSLQMSGIELLCQMCKLRMCMPAIVISGFMDARLNQASEEQGAFRCFQKPVDLDDLLAAIHAALVQAYGGDQSPAFSG